MENEQSINNVLSEFERSQKRARRFNTAATVVGVIAAVGMIVLIAAIAYKYTSTEKQLTGEVTQRKTELETKLGELQLAKSELENQQTELTRLQESVKKGSASADVITNLQRDLSANQLKLTNANDQINELKGLVSTMETTMRNPNEAVVTLTKQVAEKETHITALKNQIVEKDNVIATKDKTIAEKNRLIQSLTKKGNDNRLNVKEPSVKIQ
jgi:chromosome segregation ATPase